MSTIQAKDLRVGDEFRYSGHEYTVHEFRMEDGIVSIAWGFGEFPIEFYVDSEVSLLNRTIQDPKPFKVYTRVYRANGDCLKEIHSFETRALQARYVSRTNKAVTFYN